MLPAVANILRSPLRLARRTSSIFEASWADGHTRRKTGMSDVYTAEPDEESKENIAVQVDLEDGLKAECEVHRLSHDEKDNVDDHSVTGLLVSSGPATSESITATVGSVSLESSMASTDTIIPIFPTSSPAREHFHIETTPICAPDELDTISLIEIAMAQVVKYRNSLEEDTQSSPTPAAPQVEKIEHEKIERKATVVNGLVYEPFCESVSDGGISFLASRSTFQTCLPNPFSVHEQLIFAENSKLEEEMLENGIKPMIPPPRVLPPEIRVFSWMQNYWSSLDDEGANATYGSIAKEPDLEAPNEQALIPEDKTISQSDPCVDDLSAVVITNVAAVLGDDPNQPSPTGPKQDPRGIASDNLPAASCSLNDSVSVPQAVATRTEPLGSVESSSDNALVVDPEAIETGVADTQAIKAEAIVTETTKDHRAEADVMTCDVSSVSESTTEGLVGNGELETATSALSELTQELMIRSSQEAEVLPTMYHQGEGEHVSSPVTSSCAGESRNEQAELPSSGTTPLLDPEEFSTPLSVAIDGFSDAFDAFSSTSSPVLERERFETATSLLEDCSAPPSTSVETITQVAPLRIAIGSQPTSTESSGVPASAKSLDFSLATDLCVNLLREALDAVKSAEEHLDAMLLDRDPAIPAAPSPTPAANDEQLADAVDTMAVEGRSPALDEIILALELVSPEFADRLRTPDISAETSVISEQEDVIVMEFPAGHRDARESINGIVPVPIPGSPDLPACEVPLPETPDLASSSDDQLASAAADRPTSATVGHEESIPISDSLPAETDQAPAPVKEVAVTTEVVASGIALILQRILPVYDLGDDVARLNLPQKVVHSSCKSGKEHEEVARSLEPLHALPSGLPERAEPCDAMAASKSDTGTLSMEISVGSSEANIPALQVNTICNSGSVDVEKTETTSSANSDISEIFSAHRRSLIRAQDLPLLAIPPLTITLTEPTPVAENPAGALATSEATDAQGADGSAGASASSTTPVARPSLSSEGEAPFEPRAAPLGDAASSDNLPSPVQEVRFPSDSSLPQRLGSPFVQGEIRANKVRTVERSTSDLAASSPQYNSLSPQRITAIPHVFTGQAAEEANPFQPRTPHVSRTSCTSLASPADVFQPKTYADATNLAKQFPELSQEILKLPIAASGRHSQCPSASPLQSPSCRRSPAVKSAPAVLASHEDRGKMVTRNPGGPPHIAGMPNWARASKYESINQPPADGTNALDERTMPRRQRQPTRCIPDDATLEDRGRGKNFASLSLGNRNDVRANQTPSLEIAGTHVRAPSRQHNATASAEEALRSMQPRTSPLQRPRNPTPMIAQRTQSLPSLQRKVTLEDLTRSGPATHAELRQDEQRLHGDSPATSAPSQAGSMSLSGGPTSQAPPVCVARRDHDHGWPVGASASAGITHKVFAPQASSTPLGHQLSVPSAPALPRTRTMTAGRDDVKSCQQRIIFHSLGMSRAERTHALSRGNSMQPRSRTQSQVHIAESHTSTHPSKRNSLQNPPAVSASNSTAASIPTGWTVDEKGVLRREWDWDRIPSTGQEHIAGPSRPTSSRQDTLLSRLQNPATAQQAPSSQGGFHPYRRPAANGAMGSGTDVMNLQDLLTSEGQSQPAAFFVDRSGNVYRRPRRISLEQSSFAAHVPNWLHRGPAPAA